MPRETAARIEACATSNGRTVYAMKVSDLISRTVLHPVPKGRMRRVGWHGGYLVVEYPPHGLARSLYIFGPDVVEAEKDKLLKVPYPDSLLQKLKAKHGWKSHKVKVAA
jgi:hypothetical protein